MTLVKGKRKWLVVPFLGLLAIPLIILATDVGPNSPATTADDATVGTVAWSNTDNAKAKDSVYATASLGLGTTSHYLKVTNFGFAIPSNATINGVTVTLTHHKAISSTALTTKMRLVRAGVIESTEKSTSLTWNTSDADDTFGANSDLWGASWTPTDINNSGFGTVLSVDAGGTSPLLSVDYISITVSYTVPTPTLDVVRIGPP